MDKLDITDALVQLGVDEDAANRLKGEIEGNDLMRLIGALNRKDAPYQGILQARNILSKYGIKLGGSTVGENYLGAKMESIRTGVPLDETFGVMSRVNEGFTYAVEVTEQNRDRVLDWLDENQVQYRANSTLSYHVECGDRDMAYRTGRALSEILRKPTVRDSVEIEEKMSRNPNKRVKDAKKKMAEIKPRNPVVAAAKTRGGAGAHDGGKDARKVDKLGRDAKHKPRFDEEIDTNNLNEGVMGMKPMNPLFRLRELAGLGNTMSEDDIEGIEIAQAPEIDPEGILSAGPVGGDDMDVNGMGSDPVADPMADMDGGMDAPMDATMGEPLDAPLAGDDIDMGGDLDVPADAGIPGAIGTDPVEAAPVPTQSDAMSAIEDSLNGIQTKLADIRLSEYKSLIQKLQDLTNQAQMMGRDYLGEQRRLKR